MSYLRRLKRRSRRMLTTTITIVPGHKNQPRSLLYPPTTTQLVKVNRMSAESTTRISGLHMWRFNFITDSRRSLLRSLHLIIGRLTIWLVDATRRPYKHSPCCVTITISLASTTRTIRDLTADCVLSPVPVVRMWSPASWELIQRRTTVVR